MSNDIATPSPPADSRPPRLKLARETIADTLRDRILSGTLAGGQPLRQDQLAREFGVSAIPVREALRELGGEGLVDFAPRRGATVSTLSRSEVIEICEMRGVLEALALEKAMPHMGAHDLAAAREVLVRADRESDAHLLAHWSQVNWAFHSTLYQPAQRPQLLRMIQNLHNQFGRYLRLHFSALDYRSNGQREHWAILRRCEQGDADGAVALLQDHIRTVHAMLIAYIDREPGAHHAS